MKKKLFFAGFLMMFTFTVKAQKSPVYELYKQKYPEAHAVRLLEEREIDISLENNEILITQDIFEEDLYLDNAATYGSKRSINYSSFFDVESIEASSLLYENGKYNELEVKDFIEKDELDGSFYDDSRSINFIYPSLQPGAKSKLKYREKIKNPRFLNSFYFADFKPIVKSKVTIKVDKDISLTFKKFNTEDVKINFSEKEKRGKKIYTWEVSDIQEYDLEAGAPNFRNTFPHIIPIITEYKSEGKKIKVLGNTSDLYNWYYSLVKEVNTDEPDQELKKIVSILTKDKKTDLEKVKAIYYWTQENIKYIAFEYALGGFIPREANDVFNKKYGDCKDNSSILYEMLEIAGLKGNLTWIGTRSIPYKYDEVPTPVVDNHMILSYVEGDDVYYLDATGRYIPIDFPSSFIQGKEALISVNDKDFSTYIKIDDKVINGIGTFTLSGYPKIDMFNVLEAEKKQDGLKDIYTKRLRKGNNKFLVDDFKEKNKFEYDKNFEVDYTFNIKDYVNGLEDEIYVNLNMDRRLSNLKSEKDRKNDKEYRYKSFRKNSTVLEIPEGKTVEYIKGNTIIHELSIDKDFILLTLEQQKELNTLIKKVEKNFKEVIILKDKK